MLLSAFIATVDLLIYLLTILSIDLFLLLVDLFADDIYGKTTPGLFVVGDYYIGLMMGGFSAILFNDLFSDLFKDLSTVFVFIDLFNLLFYRFYKDADFNEDWFLFTYVLFYFYLFLSLLGFFVDIFDVFSLSFDWALFVGDFYNICGLGSLFYTLGCYTAWGWIFNGSAGVLTGYCDAPPPIRINLFMFYKNGKFYLIRSII